MCLIEMKCMHSVMNRSHHGRSHPPVRPPIVRLQLADRAETRREPREGLGRFKQEKRGVLCAPDHRARHTFAADLRRVADLGAASRALGHSDLSTTASIYGHYDLSDLERAMEALARSRREGEEPTD